MNATIKPTQCAVTLPARQPHELVLIRGRYIVCLPNRKRAVAAATLDATTFAEVRQLGLEG